MRPILSVAHVQQAGASVSKSENWVIAIDLPLFFEHSHCARPGCSDHCAGGLNPSD